MATAFIPLSILKLISLTQLLVHSGEDLRTLFRIDTLLTRPQIIPQYEPTTTDVKTSPLTSLELSKTSAGEAPKACPA